MTDQTHSLYSPEDKVGTRAHGPSGPQGPRLEHNAPYFRPASVAAAARPPRCVEDEPERRPRRHEDRCLRADGARCQEQGARGSLTFKEIPLSDATALNHLRTRSRPGDRAFSRHPRGKKFHVCDERAKKIRQIFKIILRFICYLFFFFFFFVTRVLY